MRDYFVHPTCVVEEGARIGAGSRIWCFCHLQRGSAIGKWCSLGQNVNLGDRVKIGNFVKIQNNVSVYEGVELEDGVFCGPSCVFTNDLTPRSEYPKGHASYQKTLVRRGATIGANATVLCGNTVGRWAMVAAGAVVTHSLPDHALAAGNPARQVGWVCRCGEKLGPNLACAACGRRYRRNGPGLCEAAQAPAPDNSLEAVQEKL